MVLRDLRAGDLGQVKAIYDEAVLSSVATFDLVPPPLAYWEAILGGLDEPLGRLALVAVEDDGARVLGYARSGPFRPRAAYATTVETSVYVDGARRGGGVGRALYDALLGRLDAGELRLATAAVASTNPASIALHEACGFTVVGTFLGVGVKFGRAWDVTWYQRPLAGAPDLG